MRSRNWSARTRANSSGSPQAESASKMRNIATYRSASVATASAGAVINLPSGGDSRTLSRAFCNKEDAKCRYPVALFHQMPWVESKSKLHVSVQALVNRDLRTLAWFISFQQK